MNTSNQRYWVWCKVAAILLTALSLSPLVIPAGVYKPMLLGMPYTLWAGFLATVALVLLTYIATRVHPDEGEA